MKNQDFTNLSEKILIASPYVLQGDVFHKSLIYILSHTKDGSIGLIVNHLVNRTPFKTLFKVMNDKDNIIPNNDLILPVYLGGPLELDRGFFLHSADYDKNLLFKFQDNLAVSSNTGILKDIAAGAGPKKSLFIIGYTSWKAGQLETELENNLWIVSDYDQDLIFSEEIEQKWHIALKRIGVDDSYFASIIGHC